MLRLPGDSRFGPECEVEDDSMCPRRSNIKERLKSAFSSDRNYHYHICVKCHPTCPKTMIKPSIIAALAASALAYVPLQKRQSYSGVATFNDYAAQSNTVCGPKSGVSGTYGAAIGDLSPNIWSGAKCDGSIDSSEW